MLFGKCRPSVRGRQRYKRYVARRPDMAVPSGRRKRAGLVIYDALDEPEYNEDHQQWEQHR